MRLAARLAPLTLPLLFACLPPSRAEAPPSAASEANPSPRGTSSGHAVASPGPYSGHGADSVAPELLEKYRPRPVPPELGRRVQSLIDIRAPGVGRLSADGKAMYFGWSITGIAQVWKVDGPHSFPRQLTGGEDSTSAVAVTPDGAWIVVQRDRKGEENPGLYLQPAAGGPLVVVQQVPKVQTLFEQVSPDSKYVYFTSNDKKPDSYVIYQWDIAKGKREVVLEKEGLWHVSDLRPDGRLLLRKETGALSSEYFEWDPSQSQLSPLFGQGEKEEYEARYGAKSGEILVLTNKGGEFRRLYSWTGPGEHSALGEEVKFDVSSFAID
jgi:dipeptidyl aminopeptidase/acylaminoacyl peptidase